MIEKVISLYRQYYPKHIPEIVEELTAVTYIERVSLPKIVGGDCQVRRFQISYHDTIKYFPYGMALVGHITDDIELRFGVRLKTEHQDRIVRALLMGYCGKLTFQCRRYHFTLHLKVEELKPIILEG